MAQGGPIQRQDIITDEAIQAPLILTKNLEDAVTVMQKVRESAIQYSSAIGNTDSTKKLGDATVELSKEQEQLIKIQNQIAVQVAKNNDEYRAYQEQLKKVNDELKNNRANSDDWVRQATQQNSSLIKLEDALNKNRVAYANLRTEQERNGKVGKDLLHVIQDQDKGVKAIRDSMGQAQAHVGAYREEIEKLIPGLKTVSPELAEVGEMALGAGAKIGGFASALGVIAAVVALGIGAVAQFFERTEEGAAKQKETMAVLSSTWALFAEQLAVLGGHIYDYTIGPITHFIAGLTDAGRDSIEAAHELEEIEKRNIENIVERSKVQLEANKLMFDARDKLNKSDEERLDAAKEADKLLKKQSEVNVQLLKDEYEAKAKIIRQRYADPTLELQKEQALLQARINDAENEYFQGSRRRQALIITIDREILDRKINNEKEYTETVITNAETRIKADMRVNKVILALADSNLEDKLVAQRQYNEDEIRLVNVAASKEIEALRAAAKTQIVAAGGDAAHVAEIKKIFIEKETAILAKAQEDQFALLEKGKQEQAKIIIDNSAYFIALKKRIAEEGKQKDLANLEESFADGKVSLLKYTTEKFKILRGGSDLDLSILKQGYQDELDALQKYLATSLNLTDENKKATLALIAGLRKDIATINATANVDEVTARKETNKKLLELQNQFLASTLEVGNNLFLAEQEQIQKRLDLLNTQQDEELKLAENISHDKTELQEIEEKRKLEIEKKYTAKREEEQKKLRKSQHDQAIFQRDLAAFSIAIHTAEAVVAALSPPPIGLGPIAGIPLGVIIGAIGLLEEVALFSKPIPGYAKGRDGGKGEYAIVGEAGPELVLGGGKAKLYDVPGPVLTYLNPGDKVFTAQETQAIVEAGIINNTIAYPTAQRQGGNQVVTVYDSRMVEAIERNKVPDLVRQGVEIYKVQELRKKNRRLINSKIGRFDE